MKYCNKCGVGESEFMACEEPDCGELVPKDELAQVRAELQKALKEIDRIRNLSMCELGAEFPRAMDYMQHWEQRAESAEAQNLKLAAQVAVMAKALQFYADGEHFTLAESNGAVALLDSGTIAGKALANLPADAEKLLRLVEAVAQLYQQAIKYQEPNTANVITPATVSLHSVRIVCEAIRDLRGDKP